MVMKQLCEEPGPTGKFCTRERGHEGEEHIAAIGPYGPGAPILERWPWGTSYNVHGRVFTDEDRKRDGQGGG